MEEYYYFIYNKPIIAGSKYPGKLPKISKILRSKWPSGNYFSNRNEAEGPFESIMKLKKESFIFNGIKLQKHRQRVQKPSNISEDKGFISTEENESFTVDFMNAFAHITIGKVTNSKVKGVHFFNPNSIKIIERTHFDIKTNCYSARIEKLNCHTGKWIEKDSESTFFPDNWEINKLFHEFKFAYLNRKLIEGNKYHSKTTEDIKVEFIINQDEKILTCYPIIKNNSISKVP